MTLLTHPAVRRVARPLLAAWCLAAAAGCGDAVDRLLTATTPSRLGETSFLVPQNAPLIVNSAVADFECAFGSYVVASGLASGELTDASQTAARWNYDRRDVQTNDALYATSACTALGVYTPISTARYTADQALERLNAWSDAEVPNRQRLRATAALYAGYSYLLLAEGFCTAAVNLGPELQTANMLDSAEARFSTALGLVTAADSSVRYAALVGRARARIGKGDRTGAATDAAAVPVGFVLNASADNNSARRNNRVFEQNNASTSGVTVAAAYRALTVAGAADPRVRVTNANRLSGDQVNPLFQQNKYASLTAPIPIASGVEAQLILAEAQGGAQGVATLNALRARSGVGLPALTAAEAAAFTATLFEERRRELFLQGNRYFDVRRGNLTLDPANGTQYPKGGSYQNQRCWPLPAVERAANPNLGG
ncbi:RagB/SusD family nutrient uptake outer membrane protein [Roseisolibacter sp. H3M3-2]|uniref:RagB/SusD family nutrient uptake outer membrane protein n=1 Tax=Roseisolibacter sp. H3M3-2 TaxID=3031323 RepID=UPI0023DC9FCB|nr:RagB/SusD family nutrient uptake outer membrane protein [Roseisolibacter sp. H3M3-2]MDF1501453.1 RagB/SusD family nutrient uptake outer membrane protein [Roseisolibacter sp. H3M3-2]